MCEVYSRGRETFPNRFLTGSRALRSLQQRERDISQHRISVIVVKPKFTAEGERHFPTTCSVSFTGTGSLQQRERDISQLHFAQYLGARKFTAEGERHFPTGTSLQSHLREVYSRGRETFPNADRGEVRCERSLQQRERDISQPVVAICATVVKFTAEGERHFPTRFLTGSRALEVYSRGRETFPNREVRSDREM